MSRTFFAMMLSLDGYVADVAGGLVLPPPGPELHQHFNDVVRDTSLIVMGRRMWEVMSYWDEPDPGRDEVAAEFAQRWRDTPKAVVSTTLESVPEGVELIGADVADRVRALIAAHDGDVEIAGPTLAAALGSEGLIDEYRLYYMPVVLGEGTPAFPHGTRPGLRFDGCDRLPGGVARLRYSALTAAL